ncbi:MAG TPA: hypothetical protein VMU48_18530 [Terracidiphilus sp.]|nr:hypothetical protein [Terracidiphilus sp.]
MKPRLGIGVSPELGDDMPVYRDLFLCPSRKPFSMSALPAWEDPTLVWLSRHVNLIGLKDIFHIP